MKRLADALTASGFESVQTYVQSGNVVLDSPKNRASVSASVAATIEAEFGFKVSVVVRSLDELAELAKSHPGDTGEIDPKLLHVVFLDQAASSAARTKLDELAEHYAPDAWSYSSSGHELFVAYPNGSGISRLTLDVIERHLGATGTGRNLNTVRRLLELGGRAGPK
jgi:uncharacterized protein (DUF1697 family)